MLDSIIRRSIHLIYLVLALEEVLQILEVTHLQLFVNIPRFDVFKIPGSVPEPAHNMPEHILDCPTNARGDASTGFQTFVREIALPQALDSADDPDDVACMVQGPGSAMSQCAPDTRRAGTTDSAGFDLVTLPETLDGADDPNDVACMVQGPGRPMSYAPGARSARAADGAGFDFVALPEALNCVNNVGELSRFVKGSRCSVPYALDGRGARTTDSTGFNLLAPGDGGSNSRGSSEGNNSDGCGGGDRDLDHDKSIGFGSVRK
ncbi:hypothetical protein DFP72DRAFT_882581 [Ephemerocybe angulata]|uniref:Uncharacterized protein n=1 Tax=Ephemerocybe angulata TaxID=980116 RepID=A0A8H6I7X7_9AGAR|nr:hypothetical protein DFP72DRAFT_882581 [Tulosesus angulatus]